MLATFNITPDLVTLIFGTAIGGIVVGFGLGWLLKKAPRTKSIYADAIKPGETGPHSAVGGTERKRATATATGATPSRRRTDPRSGADPWPSAGTESRAMRRAGDSGPIDLSHPAQGSQFDNWNERRVVDQLRDENNELKNLFTLLPGLTRRITETSERRQITSLLADMVRRLCLPPPEKVLVFLATKDQKHLVLVAQDGYESKKVYEGLTIPLTAGSIGFAMKRRVVVDRKEVQHQNPGALKEDERLPFGIEIAAPMIHGKKVFGAITAESIPQKARFAKRMVTVAANLGGLALANADFVSQIRRMAETDALTKLYNKRYFREKMVGLIQAAKQQCKPLSVFIFDIDHFKNYNDNNGHEAGDVALRLTGKILRETVRDGYLAARYGGEEFIVALPATTLEDGIAFAESVRNAIGRGDYEFGKGQPLGSLSISGGVSCYPSDGMTTEALIKAADTRLYKAKDAGRNAIGR